VAVDDCFINHELVFTHVVTTQSKKLFRSKTELDEQSDREVIAASHRGIQRGAFFGGVPQFATPLFGLCSHVFRLDSLDQTVFHPAFQDCAGDTSSP